MRTDAPLQAGIVFPALPAVPGRFAAYCRRLHRCLAKHDFKMSFQLNEDPDRQASAAEEKSGGVEGLAPSEE